VTKENQLFEFLFDQLAQRSAAPEEAVNAQTQLTDLGIQSIDAVLLCGDIEDKFEVEIDPADIFEHDTVGAFAQSILSRMVD